jgi:hypothetical protein
MSKIGKLFQKNALFLCCDIQTKFMGLIHKADSVTFVGKQLSQAAKIFECPVFVTEQ